MPTTESTSRVTLWLRRQARRLYRLLRHPRYRKRSRLHDWVARHVFDHSLWRPTERSVAAGLACGLFVCMLPMPMQMFLAAALCSRFRWNIPAGALACWVTSPITWPITYVPAMFLGLWLLRVDPEVAENVSLKSFDTDVLIAHWHEIGLALLVGCLVVGAALGALGYFLVRAYYFLRKKRPPGPGAPATV